MLSVLLVIRFVLRFSFNFSFFFFFFWFKSQNTHVHKQQQQYMKTIMNDIHTVENNVTT